MINVILHQKVSLQYTAPLYSCCSTRPVSCQRMSPFELLFNFPITAPLRDVCMNISFLQTSLVANAAQQPFSTSFTKTSLCFLTGLAALQHKLARPLLPGDINPTVVVSSRLSGMWKPLLSFQRSAGARPETAVLPCMRTREEENIHLLHICLADPVCLSYCCTCTASPPPLSLPRPSTDAKPGSSTPFFPWCTSVYQPLVIWEVGFPGGTAQVAVMSLARSASRTICPSFCPHFIYVAAHLVNSRFPATHLLITTC